MGGRRVRWRAPPPPKFQPLTGLGFFLVVRCACCLVFLRGFRGFRGFRSFRGFRGFMGFRGFKGFRGFRAGVDAQAGSCHATKRERRQQPHGVDGEDLLPRKRAQRSSRVQAALHGRSSATAALALGARGSSRGTARTALSPRRVRQLGDHGANWFELNKLLSIKIIQYSVGRTSASFFFCHVLSWFLFCPGFYRVTASRRCCPAGSAQ